MGHRGVKKSGDEWDAFTPWRGRLHWKPGKLRKIKRRYNKRMRRIAKAEARQKVLTGDGVFHYETLLDMR